MRSKYFLMALCLLVSLGLLAACAKSPAQTTTGSVISTSLAPSTTTQTSAPAPNTTPATAKPATPKLLTWGTLDVGSVAYVSVGFAAESIKEKFGVTVRLVPVGNDLGKLTMARTGAIQASMQGGAGYLAREGLGDYADRSWGPQKLRMLYHLTGGTVSGFLTLGDSSIRSLKDLSPSLPTSGQGKRQSSFSEGRKKESPSLGSPL